MSKKTYCETCNAPKTDGVAILMRCGMCVVQQGKPPTKWATKENSND